MTITEFEKVYKNEELMKNNVIIDVRPEVHYGIVSLPSSVNLPLKIMERNPDEAKQICSKHDKVFVMCRRGNDSRLATELLINKCGVTNCVNVEGGIEQYSKEVDKKVPLY